METYINPGREIWDELSKRPSSKNPVVEERVKAIIERVRTDGDEALRQLSLEIDRRELVDIEVSAAEIEEAKAKHDCIRQIRKADPNIEILLIGPYFSAFGRYTPDAKGMKEAMEIVRKAAEEEHIAYFETFTPWWKKVTQEGKCIGWYKGDGNHANPRGCRLIGMMFERWFDPSL